MTYITTTKTKSQIESSTTKKHFSTIDAASMFVISKLEKQRRRIINWSDYITCISNVETGVNVYIVNL